MAKPWAKKFYNSKAWKQCRASYIKKVFGLCERCSGPGNQLHHKVYLTPNNINDPNVTLNHDKLEFLCDTCHQNEHYERYRPTRKGFEFDSEGNLIKVGE